MIHKENLQTVMKRKGIPPKKCPNRSSGFRDEHHISSHDLDPMEESSYPTKHWNKPWLVRLWNNPKSYSPALSMGLEYIYRSWMAEQKIYGINNRSTFQCHTANGIGDLCHLQVPDCRKSPSSPSLRWCLEGNHWKNQQPVSQSLKQSQVVPTGSLT